MDAPGDWTEWVNRTETAPELEAVRECVKRGKPFGNRRWVVSTAQRLRLESALRPRGRPPIAKRTS